MQQSTHSEPRAQLVDCMRRMITAGLTSGAAGNASCRCATGMLITPTGLTPDAMEPDTVVAMDFGGRVTGGTLRPSSEWPMHAAIYRQRPDVNAVVHCHSRHATALACCGRAIPAFHYMVAAAGGDSIPCAPYALFGSEELAAHAATALTDRDACLLANHGQLALGTTVPRALALALEVEELAAQYWATLAIGGPRVLDSAQMAAVAARFAGYGQPQALDKD